VHSEQGKVRRCPFCAESIKPEALVCRYCGREISEREQAAAQPKADSAAIIAVSVLILIAIIVWIYALK
jgi:predicted nucleic acid-binding Zn ribbon protein